MTALTVSNSGLSPEPPTINPGHELSWHLNSDVNPDPSSKRYDPVIRECARLYLDALAPFIAPVSEERLRLFLAPVPQALGYEVKLGRDEIEGWIMAMMITMADVPTGAFTKSTQQSLLRGLKFFPSTGVVYEAVLPAFVTIRDKVRVLRIIAKEPV